MEFQEIVRRRRMVRRYSDEPVAQESVDRLLRNAVRAPSAGFSQGWGFLVLDRPDDVARFWVAATPPARTASPDRWLRNMREAPVVVVPFSSEAAYRRRYAEPDKAGPAAPPGAHVRGDGAVTGGAVAEGAVTGGAVAEGAVTGGAATEGAVTGGAAGSGSANAGTGRGERWGVPYWHVDAGMASLLILQTAVDEGLGACFFGVPPGQVRALRDEFGVPDEYTPVGAITIGHPAPDEAPGGSATRRPRRPFDEVVHRGRWTT